MNAIVIRPAVQLDMMNPMINVPPAIAVVAASNPACAATSVNVLAQ